MDKEPERYYDWMIWKLRQESKNSYDDKIGLDKRQELATIKE